jgi:hypothetical protein
MGGSHDVGLVSLLGAVVLGIAGSDVVDSGRNASAEPHSVEAQGTHQFTYERSDRAPQCDGTCQRCRQSQQNNKRPLWTVLVFFGAFFLRIESGCSVDAFGKLVPALLTESSAFFAAIACAGMDSRSAVS